MSELEELIAAATAIVSERWGPCSDYVCEADRAGLGTECTASRGVVADVVAAILAAEYAIVPPTTVRDPDGGPWIFAEPEPEPSPVAAVVEPITQQIQDRNEEESCGQV